MPETALQLAAGPGHPLPADVRQRMEAAFGARFDDVRIHVGPAAAAVGATAITHGSHIYFAPGQYDPATPRGQQVLGHELAHVVQQRARRVHSPLPNGVAVVQDAALEAEAQRMSMRVVQQKPSVVQLACGTCGARSHSTARCPRTAAPPPPPPPRSAEDIVARMASRHHPRTGVRGTPAARREQWAERNLEEVRRRLGQ